MDESLPDRRGDALDVPTSPLRQRDGEGAASRIIEQVMERYVSEPIFHAHVERAVEVMRANYPTLWDLSDLERFVVQTAALTVALVDGLSMGQQDMSDLHTICEWYVSGVSTPESQRSLGLRRRMNLCRRLMRLAERPPAHGSPAPTPDTQSESGAPRV
jgi:hypothetical protein